MTNIRSFRELKVWQMAMDAAMRIFEVTKRFPAEEKFSLTDQVRRSSRSVPANIAGAWRKRRYPAAFISKLNDAEGESAETQTHIEIALRSKYLTSAEAQDLDSLYEQILAMLVSMANRPDDWTVHSSGPTSPRPRVSASPRLP
jgi:four helix bundle protein